MLHHDALAKQTAMAEKGLTPRNALEATKVDVSTAEFALSQATMELQSATAHQDNAVFRSRVTGIVAKVLHAEGEFVSGSVSDPVMRVIDPTRVQVVVQVPTSQLGRVAQGQSASVTLLTSATPEAIGHQLTQSLERLQLDRTAIYIMHRDNEAVQVGEFVDALNREIQQGRFTLYGGSNWSPQRFAEACAYATANDLQGPSILNNNLSLAVMERAVWPGCITSNNPEFLQYLRNTNIVHLSWSSQARGYFLPEALRNRLPADTRPEACFGSPANAVRRERAESLAIKLGVSAHNIATAWVLAQSFPSLALVGPRTTGEIDSTLPGLNLNLSATDVAWLNLES